MKSIPQDFAGELLKYAVSSCVLTRAASDVDLFLDNAETWKQSGRLSPSIHIEEGSVSTLNEILVIHGTKDKKRQRLEAVLRSLYGSKPIGVITDTPDLSVVIRFERATVTIKKGRITKNGESLEMKTAGD